MAFTRAKTSHLSKTLSICRNGLLHTINKINLLQATWEAKMELRKYGKSERETTLKLLIIELIQSKVIKILKSKKVSDFQVEAERLTIIEKKEENQTMETHLHNSIQLVHNQMVKNLNKKFC